MRSPIWARRLRDHPSDLRGEARRRADPHPASHRPESRRYTRPTAYTKLQDIITSLTGRDRTPVLTARASGPMSVPVKVLNSQGRVASQGTSVRQGDGRYAFSACYHAPENYKMKAYLATSGGIWSGSAPVTVQKGILQEVSLPIEFTPVGHP